MRRVGYWRDFRHGGGCGFWGMVHGVVIYYIIVRVQGLLEASMGRILGIGSR